jgi:hypothetical protein
MWIDLLIGVVTVLTLIGVVAFRSLSSGSIEVKLNDAIIAAIAAVLLLFITGRINKVSLTSGGVSFEGATKAILSASAEPVKDQVATLPVVPIDESLKLGVSEIPMLIGRQLQALDFLMGAGVYQGDAVRQYLESLTKYEFFRFVVLLNPDRTMFGIIDARKLLATLQDQRSNMNFASLLSAKRCREWKCVRSTGCPSWHRMVGSMASSTVPANDEPNSGRDKQAGGKHLAAIARGGVRSPVQSAVRPAAQEEFVANFKTPCSRWLRAQSFSDAPSASRRWPVPCSRDPASS